MPADDEFDDFDDDLDDALLSAVAEQAEKVHIASQLPAPPSPPRPAPAPATRNSLPPSRAIPRAQSVSVSSTTSRPVLPSTGNHAPPPQPVAMRSRPPPRRPVYRDEFPDVDFGEKGSYKPRASTVGPQGNNSAASAVDAEKEQLRAQLEQLRKKLQDEERTRQAKDGEVKNLRKLIDRSTAEHQEALQAEQTRLAGLQDKVAELERGMRHEAERHKSEMVFARQEYESNTRHTRNVGSASVAAKRRGARPGASPSVTASAGKAASPRGNKHQQQQQKKGFQNSFFDSTPVGKKKNQGLPPSSSPIPIATTALVNGKGKQRATEEEVFEFEQVADDAADTSLNGLAHQQLLEDAPPRSQRDSFVSFLFSNITVPPSDPVPSLHVLINMTFSPDTDPSFVEAHKSACSSLFACLGRSPSDSDLDVEQQDRLFLSSLVSAILRFVLLFSSIAQKFPSLSSSSAPASTNPITMQAELVLALYLLRDLLFEFRAVLFHQPIILERHTTAIQCVFAALLNVIKTEHAKSQPKPTSVNDGDAGKQATKSRVTVQQPAGMRRQISNMKGTAASAADLRVKAEKQAEPVYLAVLDVLSLLAWLPDDSCITSFDTLLRDPMFISTLLDPHRPCTVIERSLQLLTLLSAQPQLFRVILAVPLSRDRDAGVGQPSAPLAFIDALASFLLYKAGPMASNHAIHLLALSSLCNLAVAHADGVPLLGSRPVLVQRLVVRIAHNSAGFFESDRLPDGPVSASDALHAVKEALHLLHYLVLSQQATKPLTWHLEQRPVGRDYFLSGIGRLACSEPPDWLEDADDVQVLDQAAGIAHELLGDVLTPDEIDELYALCRDDEDDETPRGEDHDVRDEEEELAAQNVDAIDQEQ